jgi:hypothetical protein
LKDHPLFKDQDYLKAKNLREWIDFLQNHLNAEYDQDLEKIIVDLNYVFHEVELVDAPLSSSSNGAISFLPRFADFVVKHAFRDLLDLTQISNDIHDYILNRFRVSRYCFINYEFAGSFSFLYHQIGWDNFCDFLRARVEYFEYYHFHKSYSLAALQLLNCFDVIARTRDETVKKAFINKFDRVFHLGNFFHVGIELERSLLEQGYISEKNLHEHHPKLKKYVPGNYDPDDILDTDGLLPFEKIKSWKLRNDDKFESKLNFIYRNYKFIQDTESVSVSIVSRTRDKLEEMRKEQFGQIRTHAQARAVATLHNKELVEDEGSSSSSVIKLSQNPCPNPCQKPSALKQPGKPSSGPTKKISFTI